MERIIDVLQAQKTFAVLADERNKIVRLWTLSHPFKDGRKERALKRFFPDLEVRGEIIRLGGYQSLVSAHADIADAKTTSHSKAVQNLFRYDTPESLATLTQLS